MIYVRLRSFAKFQDRDWKLLQFEYMLWHIYVSGDEERWWVMKRKRRRVLTLQRDRMPWFMFAYEVSQSSKIGIGSYYILNLYYTLYMYQVTERGGESRIVKGAEFWHCSSIEHVEVSLATKFREVPRSGLGVITFWIYIMIHICIGWWREVVSHEL